MRLTCSALDYCSILQKTLCNLRNEFLEIEGKEEENTTELAEWIDQDGTSEPCADDEIITTVKAEEVNRED